MADLLGRGNYKLGTKILTWSLPAILTCPGRTELCSSRCYALRGRMKGRQEPYKANLEAARAPGFVPRLIGEIVRRRARVVRVHVSGDFFSVTYAKAWLRVMRECSDTAFYFYTRSWREPKYAETFAAMAALPNVAAWYSVDRETGHPPVVPRNVRVAYLAVDDEDAKSIDPRYTDLLFRDYPSRSTELRSVAGRPVCPHENGRDSHVTCESCGICTRHVERAERKTETRVGGRVPLAVL